MAVAAVLDLPGAGVPAAGIEGVEERDARQHHADLPAEAVRLVPRRSEPALSV